MIPRIPDLKPGSFIVLKSLVSLQPCSDPIPVRSLVERTHLSDKTIRRHLHMLHKLGVIQISREAECDPYIVRLTETAFLSLAFKRQYGERYAYLANLA